MFSRSDVGESGLYDSEKSCLVQPLHHAPKAAKYWRASSVSACFSLLSHVMKIPFWNSFELLIIKWLWYFCQVVELGNFRSGAISVKWGHEMTQIMLWSAPNEVVKCVILRCNLRQITRSNDANYFLKTFALHFHPIQNYVLCMMNYELNRLSLHHNSPRSIIWIVIKLWLILSLLPSCLHWHS